MSILLKVEKLICHEASARKLGSIAEADAFAAKARELLLQHRADRLSHPDQVAPSHDGSSSVTAAEAGMSALRTRQEWNERLGAGIARAFHCELMIQQGSNTVVFRGQARDRSAAALMYTELAGKATVACATEFAAWKKRRTGTATIASQSKSSVYSRRWKQSFLIGFAQKVCQRFVCDHNCLHACQHAAGLVRIGSKPACPVKAPQGRAIGGTDLLYDAVYRGHARAAAIVLDLEQRCAA